MSFNIEDYVDSTYDRLIIGIGVLLTSYLLSHFLRFLLKIYLKYKTQKTSTRFDDFVVAAFEKPIPLFVIFFGVYLFVEILDFQGWVREMLNYVVLLSFFYVLIRLILTIIDAFFRQLVGPLVKTNNDNFDDYKLHINFLRKLTKAVFVVIATIQLFRYVGYNTSGLLAGVGISSLAVGLAARDTIANMISSLVITLMDRNFNVGDRIIIDEKYEGKVISVGMRSTLVRTKNDSKLYIPNSKMTSSTLENLGRTDFDPDPEEGEENAEKNS